MVSLQLHHRTAQAGDQRPAAQAIWNAEPQPDELDEARRN
jgi:hypothetical protein